MCGDLFFSFVVASVILGVSFFLRVVGVAQARLVRPLRLMKSRQTTYGPNYAECVGFVLAGHVNVQDLFRFLRAWRVARSRDAQNRIDLLRLV